RPRPARSPATRRTTRPTRPTRGSRTSPPRCRAPPAPGRAARTGTPTRCGARGIRAASARSDTVRPRKGDRPCRAACCPRGPVQSPAADTPASWAVHDTSPQLLNPQHRLVQPRDLVARDDRRREARVERLQSHVAVVEEHALERRLVPRLEAHEAVAA